MIMCVCVLTRFHFPLCGEEKKGRLGACERECMCVRRGGGGKEAAHVKEAVQTPLRNLRAASNHALAETNAGAPVRDRAVARKRLARGGGEEVGPEVVRRPKAASFRLPVRDLCPSCEHEGQRYDAMSPTPPASPLFTPAPSRKCILACDELDLLGGHLRRETNRLGVGE